MPFVLKETNKINDIKDLKEVISEDLTWWIKLLNYWKLCSVTSKILAILGDGENWFKNYNIGIYF